MNKKQSRVATVGALALTISVTLGLVSGSVADAKKKKKGTSGKVTVSKATPTTIPVAASATGPDSLTSVPLSVGKKAKGKVVGWDSLTVTSTFTGSTPTELLLVRAELTAPNGRTVALFNPEANFSGTPNQTSGPLTETPDSPFNPCFSDATHPCPGGVGRDPEATVGPPYSGTVGNSELSKFGGVPAKGTWTVKVFNDSSTVTATLNSVSISMTLKNAPV